MNAVGHVITVVGMPCIRQSLIIRKMQPTNWIYVENKLAPDERAKERVAERTGSRSFFPISFTSIEIKKHKNFTLELLINLLAHDKVFFSNFLSTFAWAERKKNGKSCSLIETDRRKLNFVFFFVFTLFAVKSLHKIWFNIRRMCSFRLFALNNASLRFTMQWVWLLDFIHS